MPLPNALQATIPEAKLRLYLLDTEHPRGGPKARLLMALGYNPLGWQRLEFDLRTQHLNLEPLSAEQSPYGIQYVIEGPILTPSGRTYHFRSVWQIDIDTDTPRLITMVPSNSP